MGAPRKIDTQELIALANQKRPDGKNWTQSEMAEKLGVTRVAVARALGKLSPSLISSRDVQTFRSERADILAELQQTMMRQITPDKLGKASLSQIITCMAILYDKERLERGASTSNVAVAHQMTDIPDELRQKLLETARDITAKRVQESLEIETTDNY